MPDFRPPPANDLSPEENEVRAAFCRQIESRFDYYVKRYRRKHGRHLDPDFVRYFWSEYAKKPDRRAALSRATYWASRAFIDCLFKKLIKSPGPVVFFSGGPGAGKSTARSLPALRETLLSAACVLDGTFSRIDEARAAIRACLEAHATRQITVIHVYCPFEVAVRRIIRRAQDTTNGRVVNLRSAAQVHRAARETFLQLAREYDGQIAFVVVVSFADDVRIVELTDLEQKYRLEPLDPLIHKAHEILTHVVAENKKAGTPLSSELIAALQVDLH